MVPILLSEFDQNSNDLTNLFQESTTTSTEINNKNLTFLQQFYSSIFQSKEKLLKVPYYITLKNGIESLVKLELIRSEINKNNKNNKDDIHYLLLESNNLFHIKDKSLFYKYSSIEVTKLISNQVNQEIFQKLKLISVTIDWSFEQNYDILSFFIIPSEDIDSTKIPFLCLNGFAMLGCHILSWIQTQHEIDQQQIVQQQLNENKIQSEETKVVEKTKIENNQHILSQLGLDNETIPYIYPYVEEFTSQILPLINSTSQFFENIGTFVRENILENDKLLQNLFFKNSLNTLESSNITIWFDIYDYNQKIIDTISPGLTLFLYKNGYNLKIIHSDSDIQPNDFVIIYQSTLTNDKNSSINQIKEKLIKYNDLNCKISILTDHLKKSDLKSQLQSQDLTIISLNEISEQMFQFIQKRISQLDDEQNLNDELGVYHLFDSIGKLSNDLNSGMLQITKKYQEKNEENKENSDSNDINNDSNTNSNIENNESDIAISLVDDSEKSS